MCGKKERPPNGFYRSVWRSFKSEKNGKKIEHSWDIMGKRLKINERMEEKICQLYQRYVRSVGHNLM